MSEACTERKKERVMPRGWDFGVLGGVKNFSVGICDGSPSLILSISDICLLLYLNLELWIT